MSRSRKNVDCSNSSTLHSFEEELRRSENLTRNHAEGDKGNFVEEGEADNQNVINIKNTQPTLDGLFEAQVLEVNLMKKYGKGNFKGYCDVRFVADDGCVLVHSIFLWLARRSFLGGVMKEVKEVHTSLRDKVVTIILTGVKLRHLKIVLTLFYKGETSFQVEDESEVRELMRMLGMHGFNLTSNLTGRKGKSEVVAGLPLNNLNSNGELDGEFSPRPPSSVSMYPPEDFQERELEPEACSLKANTDPGAARKKSCQRIQSWMEEAGNDLSISESNHDITPAAQSLSRDMSATTGLPSPTCSRLQDPLTISNFRSSSSYEQGSDKQNMEEEVPRVEAVDVGVVESEAVDESSNAVGVDDDEPNPNPNGKEVNCKKRFLGKRGRRRKNLKWSRIKRKSLSYPKLASYSLSEDTSKSKSRSNSTDRKRGRARRNRDANGEQESASNAAEVERSSVYGDFLTKPQMTREYLASISKGKGKRSIKKLMNSQVEERSMNTKNSKESTPAQVQQKENGDIDLQDDQSTATEGEETVQTMRTELPVLMKGKTETNVLTECWKVDPHPKSKRKGSISLRIKKCDKRQAGSGTAVSRDNFDFIVISSGEGLVEGDQQFATVGKSRDKKKSESEVERKSRNQNKSERKTNKSCSGRRTTAAKGVRSANKIVDVEATPRPLPNGETPDKGGESSPKVNVADKEEAVSEKVGTDRCQRSSMEGSNDPSSDSVDRGFPVGKHGAKRESRFRHESPTENSNIDDGAKPSPQASTEERNADLPFEKEQIGGNQANVIKPHLVNLSKTSHLNGITVNLDKLTPEQLACINNMTKGKRNVILSRPKGLGAYVFRRNQILPILEDGGSIKQKSSLQEEASSHESLDSKSNSFQLIQTLPSPEDEDGGMVDAASEQNLEQSACLQGSDSQSKSSPLMLEEAEFGGGREISGEEFTIPPKKRKLPDETLPEEEDDDMNEKQTEEEAVEVEDFENGGGLKHPSPLGASITHPESDSHSNSSQLISVVGGVTERMENCRKESTSKKRKLQVETISEEEDKMEEDEESLEDGDLEIVSGSTQPSHVEMQVFMEEDKDADGSDNDEGVMNVNQVLKLHQNEESRIDALSSDESFSDGEIRNDNEPEVIDGVNCQPASPVVEAPCQKDQDEEMESRSRTATSPSRPPALNDAPPQEKCLDSEITFIAPTNFPVTKAPSDKQSICQPPPPTTTEETTTASLASLQKSGTQILRAHQHLNLQTGGLSSPSNTKAVPELEMESWSATISSAPVAIKQTRRTSMNFSIAPRTYSGPTDAPLPKDSSSINQSTTSPPAVSYNQREGSTEQTLRGTVAGSSLFSNTVSPGPWTLDFPTIISSLTRSAAPNTSTTMQTSILLGIHEADFSSGFAPNRPPNRSFEPASIIPRPSQKIPKRAPPAPKIGSLIRPPILPSNPTLSPIIQKQVRMAPTNHDNDNQAVCQQNFGPARPHCDHGPRRVNTEKPRASVELVFHSQIAPMEERQKTHPSTGGTHSPQSFLHRSNQGNAHTPGSHSSASSSIPVLHRLNYAIPKLQRIQHQLPHQDPVQMNQSSQSFLGQHPMKRQSTGQSSLPIHHIFGTSTPPKNMKKPSAFSSTLRVAPPTQFGRNYLACEQCGLFFQTEATLRAHVNLNLCSKTRPPL